ncbi:M24 family metallopeptidase [Streptomyces tremellae]
MSDTCEAERVRGLLDAQGKAAGLFAEVERRGLLVPGESEQAVSDRIRDLAAELYGVRRFWHKRIVRSGPHTLAPFRENPPDRVIEDGDILFVDVGPVFEEWEADFGRTYVLGSDPAKVRLRDALPEVFAAGRRAFEADPGITGERLYAEMVRIAAAAGWEFGAWHSGHLVGEFPHDKPKDDEFGPYIAPGNDRPMRRPDSRGRACHWILEVHLLDRAGGFAGFHEELLDLG